MKIFGREPTLVLQTVSALLAVFVAVGLPNLSAEQAGVIIAVLSAAIGAANAFLVRPLAPAAFTGLITAGAALLAAYGLDVSQPVVGAISAAVVTVLGLVTRQQVTPVPDRLDG
jgi:hypothetical protein